MRNLEDKIREATFDAKSCSVFYQFQSTFRIGLALHCTATMEQPSLKKCQCNTLHSCAY